MHTYVSAVGARSLFPCIDDLHTRYPFHLEVCTATSLPAIRDGVRVRVPSLVIGLWFCISVRFPGSDVLTRRCVCLLSW
jgi:hypothetical protein